MRPLEVLLISLLVLAAVIISAGKIRVRLSQTILAVAAAVLILHVLIEGPHWQMAPAYLGFLLLGSSFFVRAKFARRVLAGISLLSLSGAVALCSALPMFNLPRPTGPYPVATTIFSLTDQSRLEDAVHDGSRREIVVQAWYPAKEARGRIAPYRRWGETTLASSYQRFVWTHAYQNGQVSTSASPFPVLILEPAMYTRRTAYDFLAEEFASLGYAVFALDHPYNTGPVQLASGKVLPVPPGTILDGLGSIGVEGFYERIKPELEKQTADTIFFLDTLAKWNSDPSSMFYRRLDLNRIGAIGHSFGGSVVAEAAVRDPRIQAVFDMSGPLFGQARKKGVSVPFFFMSEYIRQRSSAELARMSPDNRVGSEFDMTALREAAEMVSRHSGYYAELPSPNHSIFTDRGLFSQWARFAGDDPKMTSRMHEVITHYAVAFFGETLQGRPSPLLKEEPSPFPGVIFRRAPAPAPL
ncbi:MAG: hypothetical protein JOZ33_03370 [Acidobacteriaceae bacterium]|nr:hypothetical protein [Acidobacteriaceae bacterium]